MKTKRFKTLLSLLLVLAMGLSLCGVSVFADEGDIEEPVKVEAYGDGTVTVNNDPAPAEPITVVDTTVTISEDIHTEDSGGLTVTTQDSNATVTVAAENVEGNGWTVYINNEKGGDVEVNLGGDDHGSDSEEPAVKSTDSGIVISNTGGTVTTEADGDVEAGKEAITVSNSENGTTTVKVEGDIKTGVAENPEMKVPGEHNAVNVNNESGTVEVVIDGNVESDKTGVLVNGTGKTNIEIDDTLSVDAGGTPVLIGQDVSSENLTITVWKIEVDGKQAEEGSIVKMHNGSNSRPIPQEELTQEQAKTIENLEKSINYIIRIDSQQKGSSLSSDKDTAKANETVKITVKIPDGHTLKAVYTDEGQTLTAKDNGDGTFTLTVPVGGGVYVHADFAEIPAPSGQSDSGGGNDEPKVKEGTVSYDLGTGTKKYTILAGTLKTLIKARSLQTFVFNVNGKVYTVKAEDLLALLASSPSVTLYADGDRLVLDFGNGEIVLMKDDETAAADQKKALEVFKNELDEFHDQNAVNSEICSEKVQTADDSYYQGASQLSKQLGETGLDKETFELMQEVISEDGVAFGGYKKERTDALNDLNQQVEETVMDVVTLAGSVTQETNPQTAAEEQIIVNDLIDQAKGVISESGENLKQQIDDASSGSDSAQNEEQSQEQAGGDEANEQQVSGADAQTNQKVQELVNTYFENTQEACDQIDQATKEGADNIVSSATELLDQVQQNMNDQVSENQTQQDMNDQESENQTQDDQEEMDGKKDPDKDRKDGDRYTSASNTSATNYTSAIDASEDYSFSYSGSAKPISGAADDLTKYRVIWSMSPESANSIYGSSQTNNFKTTSDSPYSGYYKDDPQSSINLPDDIDFAGDNSLFNSKQTYGNNRFTAETREAPLANEVKGGTIAKFSSGFAIGDNHDIKVKGTLIG